MTFRATLKEQYTYHDCESMLCPLHARIVPRALQMDRGRIDELHAALQTQHPVVSDTVLTTIATGLAPTLESRIPEAPRTES